MARNRKSQSDNRFGPAVKAFLLCLLIGGSGVGYVWQKDQIERLGQQIKIRETTLNRIEGENEKLRNQLATLRQPHFLQMQIQKLNLGLVPPSPTQFWRLPEPAPEPPRPASAPQYAAQQHLTRTMP